jgi:hypothetical protein
MQVAPLESGGKKNQRQGIKMTDDLQKAINLADAGQNVLSINRALISIAITLKEIRDQLEVNSVR